MDRYVKFCIIIYYIIYIHQNIIAYAVASFKLIKNTPTS